MDEAQAGLTPIFDQLDGYRSGGTLKFFWRGAKKNVQLMLVPTAQSQLILKGMTPLLRGMLTHDPFERLISVRSGLVAALSSWPRSMMLGRCCLCVDRRMELR